jgi:hypothetical protein
MKYFYSVTIWSFMIAVWIYIMALAIDVLTDCDEPFVASDGTYVQNTCILN